MVDSPPCLLYFHFLDVVSQWQPSGFDGELISSTFAGAKSEHSLFVKSVPPVKLAEQVPDVVSATTAVFVFVGRLRSFTTTIVFGSPSNTRAFNSV